MLFNAYVIECVCFCVYVCMSVCVFVCVCARARASTCGACFFVCVCVKVYVYECARAKANADQMFSFTKDLLNQSVILFNGYYFSLSKY